MITDTTPGLKKVRLSAADKHHLVKLALEAEIAKKKANLAHAEWQMASAVSEAAGDAVRAKLRVPEEAQDVTIDLNDGIIQYRMPGIPPADAAV
ncbi:MAG: hypothetical protein AB7L09_00120 [Nitrospira sp.]